MSASTRRTEFEQPAHFAFTAQNLERAKRIFARYPDNRRQSAMMPLLDLAQRQHDGWLPRAAMDYVAEMVGVPPIKVYEVASFYTMYNLAPVGRHHVQVCTNISCLLRGSDGIVKACKDTLGVEFGETTGDGDFTLTEVECLGACVNGPMMQINDDFYEDLTPETTQAVLEALRDGRRPRPGPQRADRICCEPVGGLSTLVDQTPPQKDQ